MARHDEKTSVGRTKVLYGGDTGYRLAEVDEVLECFVVQTVEHNEAELERDPLRYSEPMLNVPELNVPVSLNTGKGIVHAHIRA